MKGDAAAPRLRFDRGEISGSLGDLGTFLPLTLGYITRCGLSPAPVFFFAGLWNVATGILLWAIFRRWNGDPARNNASKG